MTTSRRHRSARGAFVVLASCALAIGGCRDAGTAPETPVAFEESVVVRWNSAALEAVRRSRLGPPMVARALAVTNTAMYDAWSAYDARAVATQRGAPRRPFAERTPGNKSRAVSFAAYGALVDLFPSEQARFAALMTDLGYDW